MGQHDKTTDAPVGTESVREFTTSTGSVRIPDLTAENLTIGEAILIWRRREGYTQPEAAACLGISKNLIKKKETHGSWGAEIEPPFVGSLYSHEICFILRKRSGQTILSSAEQAGVSRYWYNLMEQGKACVDRLVEYWGEYER